MKHLSTPANIALALILHAYLNAGQAAEPYQPTLNEYRQPNSQVPGSLAAPRRLSARAILENRPHIQLRKLRRLSVKPWQPTCLGRQLSIRADRHRKQAPISASKRISILRPNPTRCSVNTAHRWSSNPPTDNFQSGQNSRTTTRSVGPKV